MGLVDVQAPAQVQVTCWAATPRATSQPMALPVAVSRAETQPLGQTTPAQLPLQKVVHDTAPLLPFFTVVGTARRGAGGGIGVRHLARALGFMLARLYDTPAGWGLVRWAGRLDPGPPRGEAELFHAVARL